LPTQLAQCQSYGVSSKRVEALPANEQLLFDESRMALVNPSSDAIELILQRASVLREEARPILQLAAMNGK
jgi:hypothetical protein